MLPTGECQPLFQARSPPTEGLNQLLKPVLVGGAWPEAASRQAVHRHLHIVVFQATSFVLHGFSWQCELPGDCRGGREGSRTGEKTASPSWKWLFFFSFPVNRAFFLQAQVVFLFPLDISLKALA